MPPTVDQKLQAEEVYDSVYYNCLFEELIGDDDIYSYLIQFNLWTEEEEAILNKIGDDIDVLKAELYEAFFQANKRKVLREALSRAKDKQITLYNKRHSYDHLTPNGIANIAKFNYLLCECMDVGIDVPINFINEIVTQFHNSRISETEFRSIARNEPWRSYWNASKKENNIFDKPMINYTDDQKSLVLWSSLYDSVYESMESPAESVIDDDDMLDGWLVIQRKNRENEKLNKSKDNIIKNEKIKNASNIFLPADTVEDAKKIDDLNSPLAKTIKAERNARMKQGPTKIQDFSDVKMDFMMKMNQKLFSKK